ncbi:MAG: DUF2905 family protein [Candidatus Aenigmarchaeota archaeon]|nr:DUF2905 family protein [Candidatus Aenigmarchaeota archaeon]
MLPELGKFIIIFGVILVVLGLLLTLNIPFLGRLPGDIVIKKGNFTFYFPLATSLILSLILTLVLNLILRK